MAIPQTDELKQSLNRSFTAEQARLYLAAIVESSADAIIGKDLQGIITSWNRSATRIFGYQPEEIIGSSVVRLIPPELQFQEPEILRRVGSGKRIEHFETERVRKDGSRVYVSLTISPIKDDSGQIVGISKIARDITEQWRMAKDRLHLAAIVDSSDDSIISKDLNGIIQSWNAAATTMFGYTADEIIGKSVLLLIPPDLQEEEPRILEKLRAGQKINHYETQRMRKDGERINVSITISPMVDANGKVIGASKIVRDITARKLAEIAMINSEKIAATGRMAAAIAHEVNNPLEAVTNLAFLLSHHPSLDEQARHYVELLSAEVARASQLTRQTLGYYRDTTNPIRFRLDELLDNLLELHHTKFSRKQIAVQVEYEVRPEMSGFASELRQVFANLIANAIDALPENGKLRIRVRPQTLNGKPCFAITIADNGAGMSPATRSRIFEPFFTTKAGTGTGLGLWVTAGIVKKHNGSIRVRSCNAPGRSGTVFKVFLPADFSSQPGIRP